MAGVVLEVLFVPLRAETLSVIRRAAETMDINLHLCADPQEVERLLFCHRYDGLIVEHDESTDSILRALRQSPSSRGAIAIDIHDEDINLQTVFNLGANFELVYPLSTDRVRRTLHLAVGLMMLGRRRYYRHPVRLPATITTEGRQYSATVSNVSEQGVGIFCEETPLTSGTLQCSFELPDHTGTVAVSATVVWADKTGQAGCRIEQFLHGRDEFVNWICRLFHQETTAPVVAPVHLATGPELFPGRQL
ncbi:type IV pilus assembly PilZ [Candidatus Koribacter versatilis Ellin345]|uniref:Type IV pilus assembly PilZ n=1 Tax=Koribacter versatilis (strain Ellin345) TaxID=204669 RepID=Q1IM80_KORVE|nr:PilZ domain-containing protein [Candidatus Koribacter versatilis]ABF42020.1 type IV pilus assembly PilZ [Candidatus Koribacter versatilis Ellin345]